MLAVNDLFYLAQPLVQSLFYEDVIEWLDANEIRYTPEVKFTGTSGFDHNFNFVIPKSRKQPERIVQALNHPNRDKAEAFIYAWSDTRQVRDGNSSAYAILNDAEQSIAAGVEEARLGYKGQPNVPNRTVPLTPHTRRSCWKSRHSL